MGELIPFSKKTDNQKIQEFDISYLTSMKDSPITVKLKILPQEIHTLLRMLFLERKDIQQFHQEAINKKDRKEMDYWHMIQDVLNGLIQKLKSIEHLDEIFQAISFIELDCLIGTMEEYLQEVYLLKLQLIEDDTPLVTKQVQALYQKVLPFYEEKRIEFEQKQNTTE